MLVKEVLLINVSQVLQFLTEHLEIEHMGSQKESSNISVIETLHFFNMEKSCSELKMNSMAPVEFNLKEVSRNIKAKSIDDDQTELNF